ncbi:hypothetical protein ABZ348_25375 [Streptomyces sp. NPDC005963]|uniref:hypothetical protein n=1 Tax=Streptomyces sp. NPDC005963 TaxID=3156721 RepID=UPI0033CE4687
MTVITDAEFAEASGLAPDAVQRYLRGRGWSPARGYTGGELWELADTEQASRPYEVLVPLRRHFRDYAGRVSDILETLAVVEARRPGDILREMRLPPVDWQFLRLFPPGPSGTAPLLDLVSALTGLKELHTAAAASALTPRAVQPAQKPQAVKDHVAAVRLDQSRVGSYVITAHTPLPGLDDPGEQTPAPGMLDFPEQLTLLRRGPSEPFQRRVSRMLYAGVACARDAAAEAVSGGSLNGFERYTGAGLSANLCEALVRIAGEERRGFSLSYAWSPEMPVEQPSPPVSIASEQVEALEAGAKDLRARLGQESGVVLRGMVIRLRRDVEPPEATVYGSFDHDESRQRRVRVDLHADHLDRATAAFRDRLEVAVTGDTEPSGSGVRLRRVSHFSFGQG